MIALASDCLLFRLASGESVPCSAGTISVQLLGDTANLFDAEFIQHAARAVFHYFKQELGRHSVSVGEFAAALEKVLRGFALTARPAAAAPPAPPAPAALESDLCRLASESGQGWELLFFPRLRDQLRRQLEQAPRVLHFHGLRGCVMQLAGARRWSRRCRRLEEQIVAFLRQCLRADAGPARLSLVVD